MKASPDKRPELLKALGELHLVKPNTNDQLIDEDLVLAALGSTEGSNDSKAVADFVSKFQRILKWGKKEWDQFVLIKTTAMWSVQANMKPHPRLRELLNEHANQRPKVSRLFIEKLLSNKNNSDARPKD